ncbi:hypothetical protein KA093_02235 [Candidatus Saccharibacteria bacterium]|nr:hypothetical protein [Candidatus Saccharibacteria bacterium]
MKQTSTLTLSLANFSKKILEHSTIIAFLLAMSTLIYCVISIQQIFDMPPDDQYRQEQTLKNSMTSFDQKTVDQVKQLRTTSDAPIELPSGKINPFIE